MQRSIVISLFLALSLCTVSCTKGSQGMVITPPSTKPGTGGSTGGNTGGGTGGGGTGGGTP